MILDHQILLLLSQLLIPKMMLLLNQLALLLFQLCLLRDVLTVHMLQILIITQVWYLIVKLWLL